MGLRVVRGQHGERVSEEMIAHHIENQQDPERDQDAGFMAEP
jgi:hypothetical protein